MAQPGYNCQPIAMPHGTVPSAPPLLGPSADDGLTPPSYEEVIRAPGGSFSRLSSVRRPDGAVGGVTWPPSLSGGTADPQADMETGTVRPAGQTGPTATADTAPSPPATGGTGDDPPNYQFLYGQIKDAKQTSFGIFDFISELLLMPLGVGYLIAPVVIVVLLGLVFCLPVTLLTVGFYYFSDCPVAHGIPIWMMAVGVVLTIHIVFVPFCDVRFGLGFSCVHFFAWYITGAVLIYPAWQPKFFEPRFEYDREYCDYTLMMTAFVIINLMSFFTGVACCIGCHML